MIGIVADFIIKYRRFFIPLLLGVVVVLSFIGAYKWAKAEGKNECRREYALAQSKAAEKAQKQIAEVKNDYAELKEKMPKGAADCASPAVDFAIDSLRDRYNRK